MSKKFFWISIILIATGLLIASFFFKNIYMMLVSLLLAVLSEKKSKALLFEKQDSIWDRKRKEYKDRMLKNEKRI